MIGSFDLHFNLRKKMYVELQAQWKHFFLYIYKQLPLKFFLHLFYVTYFPISVFKDT